MTLRQQLQEKIGVFEVKNICKTYPKEELFALLFEDGKIAENSAWVMTHLPKTENRWLNSCRNTLIDLTLSAATTTKKRLCLTLIERCVFEKEDIRGDFVDFCFQNMTDPNQPAGVQTICMKLAFEQCIHYPELLWELKDTLILHKSLYTQTASKHKCKQIIEKIDRL